MNCVNFMLLRNMLLVVALAVFIGICGPKGALADVTITDPSLPPLTGHWSQTSDSDFARYAGSVVAFGKALEGEIHLRRISLREFHNIRRSIDGADEIIEFDGAVQGNVFYMRFVMGIQTSEDDSSMTFYDMAHMRIRVKGKAGHTTGTFDLELESLLITLPARDVAGNRMDVVYVRNVQGQNSGGSITISEQGGGSYLMSGYLNAYTEGAMPTLSASEYFPDTNGPVYLELQSFTSGSCDLSVSQTASTPVYQGGNLTYTITVTNSSSTWADEVILAETLPAGATLVAATLESVGMFGSTEEECALTGGDLVCTLNNISSFSGPAVVKVTVTLPAAASVTNSVRVTSMNPDPDLNNNKSELTTAVSTTSSSADLSVTQTASPDPGIKNSNLTYTVTVSNNGPSASGVVLTDVLPDSYFADYVPGSMVSSQGICSIIGGENTANCDLGTINPGGTASFSIAVKPKEPFKLTNRVAVSSSVPDPDRANNSSTLETKVSPTDLRVTQSANPSPATVGGNLTYTITVNNNGPEAVEDMNIADTIPGTVNIVSLTPTDTCDWGPEKIYCRFLDMAAGGSGTVTLVVTPTVAGSLINEVELVSSTPNVNTANNFSSISTEVATATKVKVVVEGQPSVLRDTLASAYGAAPTGATIQARSITFPEELTFGEEKVLFLKGGYDAGFSGNDGSSILDGTLTIGRGAVTIERFIIQ
jgi:uncharacterized repeat protein (TIGR01451 family)